MTSSRLALLFPSFHGGGIGRVMLNLAGGFVRRGHRVDLVVLRAAGELRDEAPAAARIVELCPGLPAEPDHPEAFWSLLLPDRRGRRPGGSGGSKAASSHLPALVRYLEREPPDALLSTREYVNLMALSARRRAGGPARIVIGAHTMLAEGRRHPHPGKPEWWWRYMLPMLPRVYPWADAFVAVSDAAADDLARMVEIPRERITTIHNPVVDAGLLDRARAPVDHAWLRPDAPPVVLGAGRLVEPKDFATLIAAFARVRARCPARLVILGGGPLRGRLEALAASLGITGDVAFPGFVRNPWAWMARAGVFVLSSRWEGLGNVLIEALACGCPVVSTDCPGGPREILAGGQHGRLVPVGDVPALADAILAALEHPPSRRVGGDVEARTHRFSVDRAVERYLDVLLGRPNAAEAEPRPPDRTAGK